MAGCAQVLIIDTTSRRQFLEGAGSNGHLPHRYKPAKVVDMYVARILNEVMGN